VRAIPLVLLLSIGASEVHAADLRIVVHVANHATVTMTDLQEAQRQVIAVYRDAGVVVDFTTTPRPILAFGLAHHVELVVLSDEMLAMEVRSGYVTAKVVGNASRALMRAYIYYRHLAKHASDTRSPISRALGIAIAHEIAHLLLPRHSHSTNGIMQAQLTGRVTRVPRFTASQAAAMRGFLNEAAQGVRDRLAGAPPRPPGTSSVGSEGAMDLRGDLAARDVNADLRVR
jgi:hypothetical protein